MVRYLTLRVAQMLLVVIGVLTILFVILRISGDPIALFAPLEASPAELQRLRQVYGFDEPIWIQYVRYLSGVAHLEFGRSLISNEPAMQVVLRRIPATAQLAIATLLLSVPLGISAGVVASARRGRPTSYVVISFAVLGQSIPTFWLGLLLIVVFSVWLRVLPSFGYGSMAHIVLPTATLSAFLVAKLSRLVRAEMLDVLEQEFVRVGRAKGLTPRRVMFRYGLRNALIPVTSLASLEFSHLLGGAVVTESVFAWPGVGRQLIEAVLQRDYPVVQAAILVITVMVVVIALATDLLYTRLDPRVRLA